MGTSVRLKKLNQVRAGLQTTVFGASFFSQSFSQKFSCGQALVIAPVRVFLVRVLSGLFYLLPVSLSLPLYFAPCSVRAAETPQSSFLSARVKANQAIVYSEPDFDSEPIGVLKSGQSLRVSSKAYGPFRFRQIRFKNKIGWVAEIDLAVMGGRRIGRQQSESLARSRRSVPHSQRRSDQASRSRSEKEPERLPIYFSRFVGVTVGPIVWTEDISGSEERESLWGLGLKLTGPDVVLTGPIMELNAFIHFGAPKTLERISTIQPYGFILALDTSVVLPFLQRQNLVGFFSAGPLALYSTFKMAESGRLTDRDSLQVGAALAIGFAQRFDRVTIRLEGKSLIARKTYPVAQLSIQTQF